MSVELIIPRFVPEQQPHRPTTCTEDVPEDLTGDMDVVPPDLAPERVHPEVPCDYGSDRQKGSPSDYVNNPVHLQFLA